MRDKIILDIANNQRLKDNAKAIFKHNDLWQDAFSDVIVQLYDMPEKDIIEMNDRGVLFHYCYRILWLSYNSPTSPFYKKYLKSELPYTPENTDGFRFCEAYINDRLHELEKKAKSYPVEVKLFRLYMQFKSYGKVSKETGIPAKTIYNIIKRLKEQI